MEDTADRLTVEQYYVLYRRALDHLEDVARLTERAIQDLEELQSVIGIK